MSYDIAVNFRATSGFVTDGANETYSLGEAYPTTRSSKTFGWSSSIVGQGRDRNSGIDRRLAGINYLANNVTTEFRLDLPATGIADIHIACGDASSVNHAKWEIYDDSTLIATIDKMPNFASNEQYLDASNVVRLSAAAWTSSEVAISHTFSSQILRIRPPSGGSGGANVNVIAHVRVVQSATSNRRRRLLLTR